MVLPFFLPGGRRAWKKSRKDGYGVFIEQFPGGALQWGPPDQSPHPVDPQGSGSAVEDDGFPGNGAAGPVHGVPGQQVFPAGPAQGGGQFGEQGVPGGGFQTPGHPPTIAASSIAGPLAGPIPPGQQEQWAMMDEQQQNMDTTSDVLTNADGHTMAPFFNPNAPATEGAASLGQGAPRGNQAPIHRADPRLVQPWYLFPTRVAPSSASGKSARKGRLAFVVRREKAIDRAHAEGNGGGVYQKIPGLGLEFRGGRFFPIKKP